MGQQRHLPIIYQHDGAQHKHSHNQPSSSGGLATYTLVTNPFGPRYVVPQVWQVRRFLSQNVVLQSRWHSCAPIQDTSVDSLNSGLRAVLYLLMKLSHC